MAFFMNSEFSILTSDSMSHALWLPKSAIHIPKSEFRNPYAAPAARKAESIMACASS